MVAFAFLTPFFFLRGGLNVSLGAVFANLGLLAILTAAKMLPKLGLVLPLARRHVPEHAVFTTLLMSTGLTFGTISSLYGLNAGIIDRTQFSLLVTVVVLSAIVPTAIAQRLILARHRGRGRRGAGARRAHAAESRNTARCPRGRHREPLRLHERAGGRSTDLRALTRHSTARYRFAPALGARLTALAVEGRMPAYAATAGEVEEVKREKDEFFARSARPCARGSARRAGSRWRTELIPATPPR